MNEFYDIDPKKEDADLIAALTRIPRRQVPSSFVQATTLRFQTAVRARYWRHFAVSGAAAMIAASAMLWLILFNFPSIAMDIAFAAGKLKAVLSALSVVWSHAPQFGAIVTFSLWMVVFACVGILIKMAKTSQAAKFSVAASRTTQ